jgi:hypothetical protein
MYIKFGVYFNFLVWKHLLKENCQTSQQTSQCSLQQLEEFKVPKFNIYFYGTFQFEGMRFRHRAFFKTSNPTPIRTAQNLKYIQK